MLTVCFWLMVRLPVSWRELSLWSAKMAKLLTNKLYPRSQLSLIMLKRLMLQKKRQLNNFS